MTKDEAKTKALVPITEQFNALTKLDSLRNVIEINFGNRPISIFDLERIRVGSGGVAQFVVRDEMGDEDGLKEFDAIICMKKDERNWWEKPLEEGGGGQPPSCHSDDLLVGRGVNQPGGEVGVHQCRTCPNAVFGSAPRGRAQACKEISILFVLRQGRENSIFPTLVIVPPSSLKAISGALIKITSEGRSYFQVLWHFRVEQAKNADGIAYGKVRIEEKRYLNEDEVMKLMAYGDNISKAFRNIQVTDQDVGSD